MSDPQPDATSVREVMSQLEQDLRIPVTTLLGFADLLALSGLDDQQQMHLNRLHQAAEQILQILETMEDRAFARRRTVVYVNDDAGSIGLIRAILVHRPGVQLLTAPDAAAGLDLVRTELPDLLLLDLRLPDRSGPEVLAEIKADSDTAYLPVVVLSAEATRDELLDAGAEACLSKPLEIVEFLELLDRLVAVEPAETRSTTEQLWSGPASIR